MKGLSNLKIAIMAVLTALFPYLLYTFLPNVPWIIGLLGAAVSAAIIATIVDDWYTQRQLKKGEDKG